MSACQEHTALRYEILSGVPRNEGIEEAFNPRWQSEMPRFGERSCIFLPADLTLFIKPSCRKRFFEKKKFGKKSSRAWNPHLGCRLRIFHKICLEICMKTDILKIVMRNFLAESGNQYLRLGTSIQFTCEAEFALPCVLRIF